MAGRGVEPTLERPVGSGAWEKRRERAGGGATRRASAMKPRGEATRGGTSESSTTSGSFPLEERRGVDQSTSSSSSEIEEGMLKQGPSGDLDVPAPGEGVKGVAAG